MQKHDMEGSVSCHKLFQLWWATAGVKGVAWAIVSMEDSKVMFTVAIGSNLGNILQGPSESLIHAQNIDSSS